MVKRLEPSLVGGATALCGLLLAVGAAIAAEAAPPLALPLDTATTVGGVEVACTGIGQTTADPRWLAWPVRLELSDARDEHLSDEAASVFDSAGHLVLSVRCEAPWILLRLKPGFYRGEVGRCRGIGRPGRAPPRSARPPRASCD